jgi:hypothetical protein
MIIDIIDLDSDKPQSFKADWCTMISGNQDEFVMVLHFPMEIRIKMVILFWIRLDQMDQNGSKWIKMDQNGSKCNSAQSKNVPIKTVTFIMRIKMTHLIFDRPK